MPPDLEAAAYSLAAGHLATLAEVEDASHLRKSMSLDDFPVGCTDVPILPRPLARCNTGCAHSAQTV